MASQETPGALVGPREEAAGHSEPASLPTARHPGAVGTLRRPLGGGSGPGVRSLGPTLDARNLVHRWLLFAADLPWRLTVLAGSTAARAAELGSNPVSGAPLAEPLDDLNMGAGQRRALDNEVDEVLYDSRCCWVDGGDHPPTSFDKAPWLPIVPFHPEPLDLAIPDRVPYRLQTPDDSSVPVCFGKRFQILSSVTFPVRGNDGSGVLCHIGTGEQRAVVGNFADDRGGVR